MNIHHMFKSTLNEISISSHEKLLLDMHVLQKHDYTCWTGATLTFLGWKHMDAMTQAEKNEQEY